jgi:hypothetical protein
MTYATRKARIREWIKADAERRQRNEIARRVAEELCPPPPRPKLDPMQVKLDIERLKFDLKMAALKIEFQKYKPRPHDDRLDALVYSLTNSRSTSPVRTTTVSMRSSTP